MISRSVESKRCLIHFSKKRIRYTLCELSSMLSTLIRTVLSLLQTIGTFRETVDLMYLYIT